MEYSFEPLIDNDSKILILGSLPGVKSLREKEYYANRQNKFWEIILSALEILFSSDYNLKCAFLRSNNIALWDVIKCAGRLKSSDSNIRMAIPNDIPKLLKDYPKIGFIIFNGRFAFNSYKKFFGMPHLPFEVLLSTSPACAGREKEKYVMWSRTIRNALGYETQNNGSFAPLLLSD